ncbi:MAG: DUF1775 domain-containing protein [Hyphomicrobiaceae bacterium]
MPPVASSSLTTIGRVKFPEGVVGASPVPKPGWQIDLAKGRYDEPFATYHGGVSEGAKEVSWSGRYGGRAHWIVRSVSGHEVYEIRRLGSATT